MGGIDIQYGEGQTPIEEEEKDELIPLWVENNEDLNKVEQENINRAILFFEKRTPSHLKILEIAFVKELHRKMFEDVWQWAGVFRKTDKNIGIDKTKVITALYNLLNDVTFWIENKTYDSDEICIRCKHRLVSIHPFPNGNGRHARIFADILARSLGKDIFSWGASLKKARGRYLSALRKADQGAYSDLLIFSRS